MQIVGVLVLALGIALWLYCRSLAVKRTMDILDLTLGFFLMLFVFRGLILIFRLDTPWLELFVNAEEVDLLVTVALLHVYVWIFIVCLAAPFGYKLAAENPWQKSEKYSFSRNDMVTAAFLFSLMSLVLTAPQVFSFGGVGNMAAAYKLGTDENINRWTRLPSVLGTIWSAAAIIHIRENTGRSPWMGKKFLLAAALFMACGYMSFLFGARDSIVFGLLGIVLAPYIGRNLNTKNLLRLVMVVPVILLVAASFRFARDNILYDHTIWLLGEDVGLFRSLSLAANLMALDSIMVLVRDIPVTFPRFGALPFIDGFRGIPIVGPRIFGSTQEFENLARETLRLYYPWRLNGNPITAIGDWYVSFNIYGFLVGALFSGLLLGYIQGKTRLISVRPFMFIVTLFLATRFLAFGYWANTPTLFFNVILPIVLSASIVILTRSILSKLKH